MKNLTNSTSMSELSINDINAVSGAGIAEWGVGVGTATAFLGMVISGSAMITPIGAAILLGASISSSAFAMYQYP